jgi:hypothetical protein
MKDAAPHRKTRIALAEYIRLSAPEKARGSPGARDLLVNADIDRPGWTRGRSIRPERAER